MDRLGIPPIEFVGRGVCLSPGVDVRSYAADLDIMAELRIPRINTVSWDPDIRLAELAKIAEL